MRVFRLENKYNGIGPFQYYSSELSNYRNLPSIHNEEVFIYDRELSNFILLEKNSLSYNQKIKMIKGPLIGLCFGCENPQSLLQWFSKRDLLRLHSLRKSDYKLFFGIAIYNIPSNLIWIKSNTQVVFWPKDAKSKYFIYLSDLVKYKKQEIIDYLNKEDNYLSYKVDISQTRKDIEYELRRRFTRAKRRQEYL